MKRTIDAIYESGAFKSVDPAKVHVPEGQRVTLVVDDQLLLEPLRLAARVYEGLSAQEIDEIEHIALDRDCFFDRRAASP